MSAFKQFNEEEQIQWDSWEGNSLTVLRADIESLLKREYGHKHLTKKGMRDWLYTIGIQPGGYLLYRHIGSHHMQGGYQWRERIEFRFEDESSIAFIKMSIGNDLVTQEMPVIRVVRNNHIL